MTIVATEDARGKKKDDSSSFGHKMLTKLGWSEGKGLGKNQHGMTNPLRAVRREEHLGLGATTDTHGGEGWSKTNSAFADVLKTLSAEHGKGSSSKDKKGKKKERKSDKKKRKDGEKKTLRLAQNKVQAGHARKMREAKDISNKSKEDMAAIFGIRPGDMPETSDKKEPKATTVTPIPSDDDVVAKEEKKDKKQKKEKKEKKEKKRTRSKSKDDDKNELDLSDVSHKQKKRRKE